MQLIHLYQNSKRKCDLITKYDRASFLLDTWIKIAESTGTFSEKNRIATEQKLIDARKERKYRRMGHGFLRQAALILGRK